MAKRLFDLIIAATGLVLSAPLLSISAVIIKLCSPGPVFYRASRCGIHGHIFVMYKLRTMHVGTSEGSRVKITAKEDSRIFAAGRLIRVLKIDELPQLWNVLKGEMSLVGPRPEDPAIVRDFYEGWQLQTLSVCPGMASPGSIFNYTHGNEYIRQEDPEGSYVREFLPMKLALDMIYIRKASLIYDIRIIARTFVTMVFVLLGKRNFALPPEAAEARDLAPSVFEGSCACFGKM